MKMQWINKRTQNWKNVVQKCVTIFMGCAEKLFSFDAVADFGECEHPNTIVGVLLQIFDGQILIGRFQHMRLFFMQCIDSNVRHFVAFHFAVLSIDRRW